jgi:hypothetical protein
MKAPGMSPPRLLHHGVTPGESLLRETEVHVGRGKERKTAVAMLVVLSGARGLHPRALPPRTVREAHTSYGSYHPVVEGSNAQCANSLGCRLFSRATQARARFGYRSKSLNFLIAHRIMASSRCSKSRYSAER